MRGNFSNKAMIISNLLDRKRASAKISRFILTRLLMPLHFMHFHKVLEARIVSKYVNPGLSEKMCDIACGCEEYAYNYSRKGCIVYGLDLDKSAVKIANNTSNRNCHFVVADAHEVPFRSDAFDKVISISALEHFKRDDKAIKEMARVLKPGGILVLTVDSFEYEKAKRGLQEQYKMKSRTQVL